jgi:integrase
MGKQTSDNGQKAPSRNILKFNKTAIEKLPVPPARKRAVYRDTKTPYLELRVTDNGVKTFSVFRRIEGEPERITLGRFPAMTVEQASKKAAQVNAQIAAGINPAEIKRAIRGEPTFDKLFKDYIEGYSKPKKRTWRDDEAMYDLHLSKPLGGRKVSSITRPQIKAIHRKITKSGHLYQANRVLSLVSSVFKWAIDEERCEDNPAAGIKRNKEQDRDRWLQADELPRFFEAIAEEPNESLRDYILLSLLTGARRTNMLEMRWADVNLERAEWRIERTKNDDPQTVTLSPEAVEILRNRKPERAEKFVFTGKGKRGHLVEPRKGWERILKSAGIDDLRIHDLRGSLGSWQARSGASLAIVGKSLGHKTSKATEIYARMDLDPVRQSVERATSAILEAGGLKPPAEVLDLKRQSQAD